MPHHTRPKVHSVPRIHTTVTTMLDVVLTDARRPVRAHAKARRADFRRERRSELWGPQTH